MARTSNNRKEEGIVVRVIGTSPLSFDVTKGAVLVIKEFSPSDRSTCANLLVIYGNF